MINFIMGIVTIIYRLILKGWKISVAATTLLIAICFFFGWIWMVAATTVIIVVLVVLISLFYTGPQ